MKILTVVNDLDKGGTQRSAQNFCEAYHVLAHDSRLLALNEGGPRQKELEKAGIKVWVNLSQKALLQIARWKPEVVHLHSNSLDKEAAYQLKEICQEAKFVETNVFSKPSEYAGIIDYSYQLSEWCKYLFLSRGGQLKKCFIVPNPIKINNFCKADPRDCLAFRNKYNIPPDAFLLGRVGQSWPGKWSEYLIDVFDRFLTNVNPEALLLLVNPPKELLAYIVKKNLFDKIIYIDKIIGDDELSKCYSAIDLFLHIASQGESFGLVLAESLLCETPVVTLNTPWSDNSQAEVIGNKQGGVCANTIEEFFQLTVKLYHDKELRERLGKIGRERILNRYDYLVIAQKSIDIISRGLENNEMLMTSGLAGLKNHESQSDSLTAFLIGIKLRHWASHRVVNYLLKRLANYKAKIHLKTQSS